MKFRPQSTAMADDGFGIELDDAFVSDFDNSTIDALYALVLQRKVVVIRNLGVELRRLRELSLSLTQRATGHPQPLELRLEVRHDKDRWESDLSFLDHPPAFGVAGLLRPAHPPAHTRWIDTVRAYEHLPDSLKDLADDLRTLHTGTDDGGRVTFRTTHPVVAIHPLTGQRALFLGQSARRIVGLSKDDSDDLLDLLRAHVMSRTNQFTVRWAVGDAIVWDNSATLHDTLDGVGALEQIAAFGFAGRLPVGVDGSPSRARHGDPRLLAATAS